MADYVTATEDIFVAAGVAAFRRGDAVPAHLVRENGWGDFVSKPDTKAAKEATAPAKQG